MSFGTLIDQSEPPGVIKNITSASWILKADKIAGQKLRAWAWGVWWGKGIGGKGREKGRIGESLGEWDG